MAQPAHEDTLSLVPYNPVDHGMVRPLVDPRAAQAAIAEYESLKAAIVRPGDVQKIQGRDFLKKSFWRRVATCFGLSLDLVSEQRGHDEGGHLFYSVLYRAVAPNGRTMTADGYCSTAESGRGGWPEHNVRATAHTRAKNRAIADLVGGGEVSAEEMQDEDEAPRQALPPRTVNAAPAHPAAKSGPAANTSAFEALHRRAVKAATDADGTLSIEAWEDICQQIGGAIKPADMTPDGKRALAAYVAEMERHGALSKEAKAERDAGAFPAEVDDGGPDLSQLGTGHGP